MTQAGTGQAIDKLAEGGDGVARQAPAVFRDIAETLFDAEGKLSVFDLFEAFGKSPQALAGIGEGGSVVIVPFAALQLLPDFEYLSCLMDDPLREVLFEFFLVRHFRFPGPAAAVF